MEFLDFLTFLILDDIPSLIFAQHLACPDLIYLDLRLNLLQHKILFLLQ
jgi:hypothetical protein